MEHKTEASQAVDERADMIAALSMCAAALAQGSSKKSRDIACEYACEALRRAALKAQPAPNDPYQLDDDDDARFPNDTNVVILHIDRYWHLRGCEDICAALDAKPAPTDAAQDESDGPEPSWRTSDISWILAHLKEHTIFDTVRLRREWDEMRRIALAAQSAQLSGNSGELAQGEDSARLDAQVTAAARVLANRSADACGVNREDNWKIYGQDFIDDARAALDAARASAETGGVKP